MDEFSQAAAGWMDLPIPNLPCKRNGTNADGRRRGAINRIQAGGRQVGGGTHLVRRCVKKTQAAAAACCKLMTLIAEHCGCCYGDRQTP